jgi:hypothetical protein
VQDIFAEKLEECWLLVWGVLKMFFVFFIVFFFIVGVYVWSFIVNFIEDFRGRFIWKLAYGSFL